MVMGIYVKVNMCIKLNISHGNTTDPWMETVVSYGDEEDGGGEHGRSMLEGTRTLQ